jgi:hypothetical protein
MTSDTQLMRAMFLLGAAYAAKAVREAMSDDNIADLFPVSAVAEAASEMMAGVRPKDGSSKFDVLMRRMGVPVGNGSAVMRLIEAMRTEASDRDLESSVRRFQFARRLGNATIEAKYRAEIAEKLASGVDVPVEF